MEKAQIRVLMLSTDPMIFEDSAVRGRMREYGTIFEELHVVVLCKRFMPPQHGLKKIAISESVYAYPTESFCKLCAIVDAFRTASLIIRTGRNSLRTVVTCQDPFETGIVGYFTSKLWRIPFHIQIHTDLLSPYFVSSSFYNRLRLQVSRFLLPKAAGIRVVSNRIRRSLAEDRRFKIPDSKMTILPILPETEIRNLLPTAVDIRKKYPQFGFIILMVSRLSVEKNIEFAIEIFSEFRKSASDAGFIIVGDGPMRHRLEKKVSALGLRGYVIFAGWQRDVHSYYTAARVFLSTSLYEGYGLSAAEALILGCPVVSSEVGFLEQKHSKKGSLYVCPVNDRRSFLQSLQELYELKEGELKKDLKSVSNCLSIPTKEEFLNVYRRMLVKLDAENLKYSKTICRSDMI